MRIPTGTVEAYSFESYSGTAGERAVQVEACPTGSYVTVLSQRRLHFLTCDNDVVHFGSVEVCRGKDNVDFATHMLWHPFGKKLVICTHEGRLLFVDVSIELQRERCTVLTYCINCLRVGCGSPRVCLANEVKLGGDVVASLAPIGKHSFFACTAAGTVRVIGWSEQRVLHTISPDFLSNATCDFSRTEEGGGDTCSGSPSVPEAVFPSAVLDVCHSPLLRLTGYLLSSGWLLLTDCGGDEHFLSDELSFSGTCISVPCTTRFCINPRHPLVALATATGELDCRRVGDGFALEPFWGGANCTTGDAFFGSVRCIGWTIDGETLCVGYNQAGVVLFNYSGVCLFSSRSVGCPKWGSAGATISGEGCFSFSWCGNKLVSVDSRGTELSVFTFSEVVSAPRGDVGCAFTPIAAFNGSVLQLAGRRANDGLLDFNDTVPLNTRYAAENYPLMYGAISTDGTLVVLAGRNGFVLFDRSARRWRVLRDKREELEFTCVAQPLCLRNVAVLLPVQVEKTLLYELRLYRNQMLDEDAFIGIVPLSGRPQHLCECQSEDGGTFVLLFDASNTLSVWKCVVYQHTTNLQCADVTLELVRRTELPKVFRNPMKMLSIHPKRLAPRDSTPGPAGACSGKERLYLPYAVFVLSGSNSLVVVDLSSVGVTSEAGKVAEYSSHHLTLQSGGVFHVWDDITSPLDGTTLLVAGNKGVSIFNLFFSTSSFVPSLCVREHHVCDNFDAASTSLGLSTIDGCLVNALVEVATYAPAPKSAPVVALRMVVFPVMYGYRILEAIATSRIREMDPPDLCSGKPGGGEWAPVHWGSQVLSWMEHMRCRGTLVCNGDYLLRFLADVCSSNGESTNSQRAVLEAIVTLLQRYPEYHRIVVKCLRTMELPYYPVVTEYVGTPLDLFAECLEQNQLDEAVHLLHLIMVDGGVHGRNASLDTLKLTIRCALRTLTLALRRRRTELIFTLLPFMALVFKEIVSCNEENALRDDIADSREPPDGARKQEFFFDASALFSEGEDHLSDSIPWSFSYDVSSAEVGEIQSLSKFLLSNNMELWEAVQEISAECLLSGRLLTLCNILQSLLVSVRPMLLVVLRRLGANHCGTPQQHEKKAVGPAASDSITDSQFLTMFAGIHVDLSLTRSPRCTGHGSHRYLSLAADIGVTPTEFAFWTAAQINLYTTPEIAGTLQSLCVSFAVLDECALAINTILMNVKDVVIHLQQNPKMIARLETLLDDRKNRGYEQFIRHCIDQLN